MVMRLTMVTFDTRDPQALARWWAEQLDGEFLAGLPAEYAVLRIPGGVAVGFQKVDDPTPGKNARSVAVASAAALTFQKVDDPTPGKNRVHMDLEAADRLAEVEHLVAAGASVVGEHALDGFPWTVMADPDGNQFCVAGPPGGVSGG